MSECINRVQSFNFLFVFDHWMQGPNLCHIDKWDYIVSYHTQGIAALLILYIHNLVTFILFSLQCAT